MRTFICPNCGVIITNITMFEIHMKIAHDIKVIKMNEQGQEYKNLCVKNHEDGSGQEIEFGGSMKKYRLAYDALFNYWGDEVFFQNKKVSGADIFFEFTVMKNGEEIFFKNEESYLDISDAKIMWNGMSKKSICLIDLIKVSVNEEQAFSIKETEIAKQLREKGYSFTYKPCEYMIDVYTNEKEICSEPIIVGENTYIDFIKNNFVGFDNTDNHSAQCTAYSLNEID